MNYSESVPFAEHHYYSMPDPVLMPLIEYWRQYRVVGKSQGSDIRSPGFTSYFYHLLWQGEPQDRDLTETFCLGF